MNIRIFVWFFKPLAVYITLYIYIFFFVHFIRITVVILNEAVSVVVATDVVN